MSDGFTRTPTGIVGKWQFHSVPTVWVEGPTDVMFFVPIVDDIKCRIEAFHGSSNAKALIDGLITDDLPYLVVLDGDYDILTPRRSPHRRVVRLRRYSIENYLWEKEPINRVCHHCARSGDRNDVVGSEFDRICQHLTDTMRGMVELDVAARRSDPAPSVLPDRVERLLADARRPDICSRKIERIMSGAIPAIEANTLNTARRDVAAYLNQYRLADLLKGHILFGILRLVFNRTVTSIKGTKVIVPDDLLLQLLAVATWKRSPSRDHKALRARIRKDVRAMQPLCALVR